MRDIRPDLRDRLAQVAKERATLQARIAQLDQSETTLNALLTEEDALWEKVQPTLFRVVRRELIERPSQNGNAETADREGEPHLSNLLLEILKASGACSKQELADEAKKREYPFGEKSVLRSTHFALVGLMRKAKIRALPNGKFRLTEANEKTADATT